ncbi:MAG: hypothetical protein M3P83_06790 [Actinomycetota bacterium]|nr:hypothetical protein [Actinomycetota bacterium]
MPAQPSRRTVVSALALVPLAAVGGCTLPGAPAPPRTPGSVAPLDAQADADVAVVAAATRRVGELLAAYTMTAQRHPQLRPVLSPLLRRHRLHARLLRGLVDRTAASGRTSSRQGRPARFVVPAQQRAAVTALQAAEDEAARSHLRHTGQARSGGLARLLASLAAGEAQHVAVLGRLADDRR